MIEDVVEFQVLGPVELAADGRPVTVGAAKQRGLLALLLINANRVCGRDWLIDRLWDGDPPASARASLQAYVYRLRKLLEVPSSEVVLRSSADGYLLEVPAAAVDMRRFEAQVIDGRQALRDRKSEDAVSHFRDALDLWRGDAFADVKVRAVRDYARRLDSQRLEVVEQCIETELELGAHASAVSELEALTAAHPLREGLWRLLMLSLYRAGRQAEALAAYQRLYRLLDGELGVQPTAPVQKLQQRILAADPTLEIQQSDSASTPPTPVATATSALTIDILGPLTIVNNGQKVNVTAGRLRTILVALAMSAGTAVSLDHLTWLAWGDEPPEDSRRSLHTYAGRLRKLLGIERIVTTPSGLWLNVDADAVDALRFTGLLDRAAQAPDAATRRGGLAEALALWRGEPFQDIDCDRLTSLESPRLFERYMAALEQRVDLDLADGRQAELVAELRQLTSRYPLRESLWVRLLVALDRSGRQAEALDCFETVRRHLAEELGADPGPELRRVHADLLAGRTAEPSGTTRAAAPPAVVPRLLPAGIGGFTGRDAQLAGLDALLDGEGRGPGTVVTTAIAGTAGIGKTALALHWAHRVAERFPDGQLYVNLRGFDPASPPMSASEAIRAFLDALEVTPQRIPAEPDAQANLYRSLLADKRMLVVLDNARDVDQARPLLPTSSRSLAIVTSRNQLSSLIANGAHSVRLDLLSVDEAHRLLTRRLGKDRTAAEPEAVDQIIDACARLPLALSIVAARAAAHPDFPLSHLAGELHHPRSSLDALADPDPTVDIRAVFSWSYRALSTDAARLFRLLGLHPGHDISTAAAASLAGIPPRHAHSLLTELAHAHLVLEESPGRYSLHDLLRTYATELTQHDDNLNERHDAIHRVLDHYLHHAHTANQWFNPIRAPIRLPPTDPKIATEPFADRASASSWFSAEHAVLMTTIGYAADHGFDNHCWQLAWTMSDYLNFRGYWQELAVSTQTAMEAAERLGDVGAQARIHRILAIARTKIGDTDRALTGLDQAIDLYKMLDDQIGLAHTYRVRSNVCELQHRFSEALDCSQRALTLYRADGHLSGQANALNAIGWYQALLGDYRQALTHCQRAMDLHRDLDHPVGRAATLDTLGYAHHQLGQYQDAAAYYQQALDLHRSLGYRLEVAKVCHHLGDSQHAIGDHTAARRTWQEALSIFEELGHPNAGDVRAKLDDLNE